MKAELIITDSNSSRKDIESWLGPKKTEVIYLAASKKFSPHIGMSDLFSRFSIRPSKFILYVGNNRPNKNLKGLLLAYAEIKDKIPAYCNLLLTCNKNSELDEIMKEYFLEDSIKFIGSVSDDELILLYSYSLFFILPSIYEGFGLPVLEAMACGCPVTCSSSASLPEIGGDAVLYFEPEKTENIVNALEIMYSDNLLREQLSNKGLKQARKFSWEKTALETYNLYKEIIYETRIN